MKMTKLFATAAIAALALGGATTLPTAANAETATPRIIGGGTADFSKVPYAAKLLLNGQFSCTSEVISSTWVMTAKHCVNGTVSIKVGSASLTGGTEIASKRVVSWSGGDISLVELAQPTNVTPASLSSATPSVGTNGDIYGWGRTSAEGPAASNLKTARVRVSSTGNDFNSGPVVRFNGIDGSCWKGDSGGPLVIGGKVVGVASTSSNGGTDPQGLCSYVDVSKARSWIKSVTGL